MSQTKNVAEGSTCKKIWNWKKKYTKHKKKLQFTMGETQRDILDPVKSIRINQEQVNSVPINDYMVTMMKN